MITLATAGGRPMWRSVHARICGPSLSRKNRLSAVKDRNTASEASALMPVPSPSSSAWNASLTVVLASPDACCALSALTPASFSASWSLATACWSVDCIVLAWLTIPPSTSTTTPTPRASSERNTTTVAAARGMCFARRRTSGAHTAATIVAVTTGMTIVFVSASSVTAATISAADADQQPREHAEVAQPARRREDPGQLARLEIDEVGRLGVALPGLRPLPADAPAQDGAPGHRHPVRARSSSRPMSRACTTASERDDASSLR